MKMLKLRHCIKSKFFPTNQLPQDLVTRFENIEANQKKILESLQAFENDNIPRNAKGIHKIGPTRTIYFFNNLLPSIYLNLVSVLQGVVLGLLIDEFSFDFWSSSPMTYAYLFSSFLIIIAFWYSYLSAIFDGRWPFHIYDTILFFSAASAQAVAVKHVATPSLWCFSMGIMTVIVGFIYLRQIRLVNELGKQETFQHPAQINIRVRGLRLLVIAFVVMSAAAFFFGSVTVANPETGIAAVLAILLPLIYIGFAVYSARSAELDVIA